MITVVQGSSTICDKLHFEEITDYSSADWVAHVYVADCLGGAYRISRLLDKALDNSGFLAYLRPEETLALPAGTAAAGTKYALAFVLTNLALVPKINHEVQHVLIVTPKT